MIFPHFIKSIQANDMVLEVGPGAEPFDRSDILLEKKFESDEEWIAQCGGLSPDIKGKKIIYYTGEEFPFKNKEFDYVICSHVLEHVENVEKFVSEVERVGKKGYFEFPLIYYDFMYNFPEHLTFLYYRNNTIQWMNKKETNIAEFKNVQLFFNKTLNLKYSSLIEDLCYFFFQGFEWSGNIQSKKVNSIIEVCHKLSEIEIPPKQISVPTVKKDIPGVKSKIKSKLISLINKF